MKRVHPLHTLAFLLGVGAIAFTIMWFAPTGGYQIAGATVRYPDWDEFWAPDTSGNVDMQALLRASHTTHLDSAAVQNIEERRQHERLRQTMELRKLQFSDDDINRISRFARTLKNLQPNERLRVLHYGDSQLEGDRITSYLREKWQSTYGGNGPGLLPAVPFTPNFSIEQSHSPNWVRYTAFGKRDAQILHSRYGYSGVMARFTSPVLEATNTDTATGWIEFEPSRMAYPHSRDFYHMRLYFGHHRRSFELSVYVNDTLFSYEEIPPGGSLLSRRFNFATTPGKVRIVFRGTDSPEVYGITLNGKSGVSVDNMPMRGAAGTLFTLLNRANFADMLSDQSVALVLLQYGGNTVPYIRDEEHAREYAERFRLQIRRFKLIVPQADIIVIGPSDMNEKKGMHYTTYRQVPWVRDALREVALDEQVGFWDIYGAMGGHNSMSKWVDTNPPLASTDYIHFTPKGAQQIAEWLYDAFEKEMNRSIDSTQPLP